LLLSITANSVVIVQLYTINDLADDCHNQHGYNNRSVLAYLVWQKWLGPRAIGQRCVR